MFLHTDERTNDMWMNEWEVEETVEFLTARQDEYPNLYRGARTLERLKDWTNSNSDGWPYWNKPSKAADSLMDVLRNIRYRYIRDELTDITEAELKKLESPIKAFLTRHGSGKDVVFPPVGDEDLPVGYRWATAEETEWYCSRPEGVSLPNFIVVRRTVDSKGRPYTQDEADLAVRV